MIFLEYHTILNFLPGLKNHKKFNYMAFLASTLLNTILESDVKLTLLILIFA